METSDLRFYVLIQNEEIKEVCKKLVNTGQGHNLCYASSVDILTLISPFSSC